MRILIHVPPEGHQIVFWNIGMHTTTHTRPRPFTRQKAPAEPTALAALRGSAPQGSPQATGTKDVEEAWRHLARALGQDAARRRYRQQRGIGLVVTGVLIIGAAGALALGLLVLRSFLGGGTP
jgi:hypothetical protein